MDKPFLLSVELNGKTTYQQHSEQFGSYTQRAEKIKKLIESQAGVDLDLFDLAVYPDSNKSKGKTHKNLLSACENCYCYSWWHVELTVKAKTIVVNVEGRGPLVVEFSSGDTVRKIISKALGRDNWEFEYGVTNDEGYYGKNDRPDGSLPVDIFRFPYPCINTVTGSYIRHGDPDYMYGMKLEALRMYLNINLFTKVVSLYKDYSGNPNPDKLQLVLLEKALKNIFS